MSWGSVNRDIHTDDLGNVLISRREFIVDTCTACVALGVSGCQSTPHKDKKREINLGPASALVEGPNLFDVERVVVIKSGDELRAMSLVCTHQVCALNASDRGLVCPCHGSQFSWNGEVEVGPATEGLPHYSTSIVNGEVLVQILD